MQLLFFSSHVSPLGVLTCAFALLDVSRFQWASIDVISDPLPAVFVVSRLPFRAVCLLLALLLPCLPVSFLPSSV